MEGCSEGCVVWFTGLSGAGKSTLAEGTFQHLSAIGRRVEILDADSIRPRLCKGLGYTPEDRMESIRRLAFVANLLSKHGVIVLVPAIAPYRSIREEVRQMCQSYIEVYVNAPLSLCEARDPKGLYRRARAGEIANFTGLTDPYEPPEFPDVECRTDLYPIEECVQQVIRSINTRGRGMAAAIRNGA